MDRTNQHLRLSAEMIQWEFQDPMANGGTYHICLGYFCSAYEKGDPQNMAGYSTSIESNPGTPMIERPDRGDQDRTE